jgi:hypothetical protein
VWGVILAKVISKNVTRLKKRLQRIYFSLMKGLSKMAFLHLKHMHLRSVSLAFMWVCKVISHYSFKWNSTLESPHGVFFCFCLFVFFSRFSRCMVTFLRNHLNFQNSFVSDKHQYYFCFCTKLWIPKNPYEHVRLCIVLEEKGNTHRRILGTMVLWVKSVLGVLFTWNNNRKEDMSWTQENTWSY